jgi:hypothetical protein
VQGGKQAAAGAQPRSQGALPRGGRAALRRPPARQELGGGRRQARGRKAPRAAGATGIGRTERWAAGAQRHRPRCALVGGRYISHFLYFRFDLFTHNQLIKDKLQIVQKNIAHILLYYLQKL